jgi:hypothetical protein
VTRPAQAVAAANAVIADQYANAYGQMAGIASAAKYAAAAANATRYAADAARKAGAHRANCASGGIPAARHRSGLPVRDWARTALASGSPTG